MSEMGWVHSEVAQMRYGFMSQVAKGVQKCSCFNLEKELRLLYIQG